MKFKAFDVVFQNNGGAIIPKVVIELEAVDLRIIEIVNGCTCGAPDVGAQV